MSSIFHFLFVTILIPGFVEVHFALPLVPERVAQFFEQIDPRLDHAGAEAFAHHLIDDAGNLVAVLALELGCRFPTASVGSSELAKVFQIVAIFDHRPHPIVVLGC
jgi:hypothetical protein